MIICAGKRVPRNVGRLNMLQGLLGIFSGLITPVQTAVNVLFVIVLVGLSWIIE